MIRLQLQAHRGPEHQNVEVEVLEDGCFAGPGAAQTDWTAISHVHLKHQSSISTRLQPGM